jgi:hypothetical protein
MTSTIPILPSTLFPKHISFVVISTLSIPKILEPNHLYSNSLFVNNPNIDGPQFFLTTTSFTPIPSSLFNPSKYIKFGCCIKFNPKYLHFHEHQSFNPLIQPLSYQDALNRPNAQHWHIAITSKFDFLMKKHAWELIDNLPMGRKPMNCKWIFKLKLKPYRQIECYKARLFAKRYSQVVGMDYHDIFFHLVKIVSIFLLMGENTLRASHFSPKKVMYNEYHITK